MYDRRQLQTREDRNETHKEPGRAHCRGVVGR